MRRAIAIFFALSCVWRVYAELPFAQVVLALDNYSRQLQVERAKMMGNRYAMKTERNLDDPTVEVEMMSPRQDAELELVVSQEFAFPTKYARMRKSERMSRVKDSLEYALLRRELMAEVYDVCAEIVYCNRVVEMDSLLWQMAKGSYEDLKRGMDAGRYNILEINSAQMLMVSALSALNEERQALEQSYAKLSALLGGETSVRVSDRSFPIVERFYEGYPSYLDEMIAAEERLSESQVKVARAEAHPALSAGYKMVKADDMAHGFVVGTTLPVFSARGKRSLAQTEGAIATMEARQRVDELRAMLDGERRRAKDYEELVRLFDRQTFEQTPVLLRKAFEGGRITGIEYDGQLSAWYENQKFLLQQERDYCKSLLRLVAYCAE